MTVAKKNAHKLARLIPDKAIVAKYVNRYFDGFEDFDILEYALGAKKNVLLTGPTGPGKTSMLVAFAAKHNIPIATIQCNGGADAHAVFGGLVQHEDRSVSYVESDVITVIREGGILYFDELNFLPPRFTATYHPLLDFRRAIVLQDNGNEYIEAHPDLLVVASFNPNYEGTRPLNQALANRFQIKLVCDYDPAIERKLIPVPRLLLLASELRGRYNRELFTPVSTNMLQEFVDQCETFSFVFAEMNFVNAFADEERQTVRELFTVAREDLIVDLRKAGIEVE